MLTVRVFCSEGQSGRRVIFPQRASSPTDSAPQVRLPDVSELLGPGASDRAATSGTQKKRPASNGSARPLPRAKIPRGNLHPARVAPDTAGGLLTPPQLRGRFVFVPMHSIYIGWGRGNLFIGFLVRTSLFIRLVNNQHLVLCR